MKALALLTMVTFASVGYSLNVSQQTSERFFNAESDAVALTFLAYKQGAVSAVTQNGKIDPPAGVTEQKSVTVFKDGQFRTIVYELVSDNSIAASYPQGLIFSADADFKNVYNENKVYSYIMPDAVKPGVISKIQSRYKNGLLMGWNVNGQLVYSDGTPSGIPVHQIVPNGAFVIISV